MLGAAEVFAGPTATWLDDRFDYGEARWLTAGFSRRPGRVDRLDATRRISPRDLDEVSPCQANSAAASPRPSAMRSDDDLPDITDDMLARAELRIGGRAIRRGRPPSAAPKQAIKLRLDPEVLAYFRSKGPGWQTRINATLRRAAKRGA
jgi:uncharacterized protein (DUF4415 family)